MSTAASLAQDSGSRLVRWIRALLERLIPPRDSYYTGTIPDVYTPDTDFLLKYWSLPIQIGEQFQYFSVTRVRGEWMHIRVWPHNDHSTQGRAQFSGWVQQVPTNRFIDPGDVQWRWQ